MTFIIAVCCGITGYSQQQKIDLLIYNANVYTVDKKFSRTEAVAVDQGTIVATGKSTDLLKRYAAASSIDAKGNYLYPGFIDAHSHFISYSTSLYSVDLYDSKSSGELSDRVSDFAKKHPALEWITGRGWDQNKFADKAFPDNDQLNELFPDKPVLLGRVDGHAALANQKALDLAHVHAGDTINGGVIGTKNGKLTGLLVDNAVSLVASRVPRPTIPQLTAMLKEGEKNCFGVGLTTVSDCGIDYKHAVLIDSLQRAGAVRLRVFAMLGDDPANYLVAFRHGKINTGRMHVNAFKVYADGALGSRGACLLQPYADQPGWTGFLLSSSAHFDSVAKVIYEHDWQMCTHAIGDSANRVVLQIYGKYLQGKNDKRWRIEHAQVVSRADIASFGRYNIIPSVQPTHATSDMYWAGDRLGPDRLKTAYAYRDLLNQNGWIPLGTDFPVEDISPLKTFYAAVVRKDPKGWPPGGFQPDNALTRIQALRGMTIWAAMANFEESVKGSIERGKMADLVLLDQDLLTAPASSLLSTHVVKTWVGGELVFDKK
ncbi:MAG TPA: amidohydrolase [Chitinophagaceae bacterium]